MTTYPIDDNAIDALFVCLIWQASEIEMDEGASYATLDYLGYERDDIARADQELLIEEFRLFCYANDSDVREFMAATDTTLDQVAHDFILTRNRHGAGFWGRGAGGVGERLTNAAHGYGEVDLYLDDNKTLHIT